MPHHKSCPFFGYGVCFSLRNTAEDCHSFSEATIQACNNSESVQFSCGLQHKNVTQNYIYLLRKSQQTCSSRNMETEVKSEADFRDFLDEHVRWNISFFVVDESNERCLNLYKLNMSSNSQLHTECYEEMDMFGTTHCGCNYTDEEEKQNLLRKTSSGFMILGVISLIGNITVIFIEVRALIQKHLVAKEKTVYRVLILNLSISDLLMGIYITLFSIIIQFNELLDFNMIPELCHFFGVISVLSSEISVTVLVLICLYRWVGIAYPYKEIGLKELKIIIALMWIIWLIVAFIPALSVDLTGFTFIDGIQFLDKPRHYMLFYRALEFFQHISNGSSNNNVSQVIPVFKKLIQYNNRDLLHTLLNHSGILKDNAYNYLGYYSYDGSCSLRTFITTPFSDQYYTLCILFYNLFAFIFIFIACIVICKHLAKNVKMVKQNCRTVSEQRLSENNKIYLRLFLVIVTDFLCWVPICVTALYFYFKDPYDSDGNSSEHVNCNDKMSTFYSMSVAVLVLIPINSVINPYLYSWHNWKKVLKKCKNFVCKKLM